MTNKNKNSKKDSLDVTNDSDIKVNKHYEHLQHHTPYILNGQLYEIISRNGENVTVKCCHCPPDRVYRGSVRSTGNFHMHIKRRHSALLGKLHEMKVAALLERRDRLMKNRKKPRTRQHTNNNNRNMEVEEKQQELKIKTVFQRHQQEQQQEEALRKSFVCENKRQTPQEESVQCETQTTIPIQINASASNGNVSNAQTTADNTTPSTIIHISTQQNNSAPPPLTALSLPTGSYLHGDANNATITVAQVPYLHTLAPISTANVIGQQQASALRTFSTNHVLFPTAGTTDIGNIIKPEQTTPQPPPQAIDLTMHNSSAGRSGFSAMDMAAAMANLTQSTTAGPYTGFEFFRGAFMRIDGTLHDIHEELHTRNQIESNRIMLDLAKFKYLYPEFNYQF